MIFEVIFILKDYSTKVRPGTELSPATYLADPNLQLGNKVTVLRLSGGHRGAKLLLRRLSSMLALRMVRVFPLRLWPLFCSQLFLSIFVTLGFNSPAKATLLP